MTIERDDNPMTVNALMALAQKMAAAWHENQSSRVVAACDDGSAAKALRAAIEQYGREQRELAEGECDAITEINHAQWLQLENVRLLAGRHRHEEWAQHMLRFCEEAGNASKVLRQPPKREQRKAGVTGGDADAAPQSRKPLRDEQIVEIGQAAIAQWVTIQHDTDLYRFARAIERAHGIRSKS